MKYYILRNRFRERFRTRLLRKYPNISRKRLRKLSRQHDRVKTYQFDLRKILIENSLKDKAFESEPGFLEIRRC